MTFEELKKRAYHNRPIPADLNACNISPPDGSMRDTAPARSTGRKPSRCWVRCRNIHV